MKKFDMRLTPLNIVTFYACIGGVWILFSGARVFSNLLIDKATVTLLEINSIMFIFLTSWLLFFLIQKAKPASRIARMSSASFTAPLKPIVNVTRFSSEPTTKCC